MLNDIPTYAGTQSTTLPCTKVHISSARRSVGIIYAVIDCKFYVRIDCSCAQHAWYDDKMENSSYKRP